MVPENLQFRADQHFYPFVVTFFACLAGLQAFLDPRNPMGILPNQRLPLAGQIHTQFSISTFELFKLIQGKSLPSEIITARLCCMLTNACYETVKGKGAASPERELFRHIRNASSHGNSFYFNKDQPSRPAVWQSRIIPTSPKGTGNPLFGTTCFFEYLGPADLIRLLWDIEQQCT